MPRESKLTEKDMSVLREGELAKKQRDRSAASVREYSLNHRVRLYWDLNEEATRDMMFRMVIDNDIELILDAEEMMRYLRWV
jgi:hypothetical protein